jgi:hypothetical protein
LTAGVPDLPGLLSARQAAATAKAIAEVQQPDGGIPWAVGEHIDAWNHVEGAMALLVGGEVEAASAAYDWCARSQRADGSWPMKVVGDRVEDASGDTNMTAYVAVGVWHHWLVRRDERFVRRMWPAVRDALDYVTGLQLAWGGMAWAEPPDGRVIEDGLLAGSSSIHLSLRAGLALAGLLDDPQPGWEIAAGRLRHALEAHRDHFLDKSSYAMDWYYPVLAGPVRGSTGRALLDRRWSEFVVDGLGCRCIEPDPWVTGAETCELVLALDNLGERGRARELFGWMQHTRHPSGLYWTGYVYTARAHWPGEQTTYTSAAVLLAADALSGTTGGCGVFRGDRMPEQPRALASGCGCVPVRDVPAPFGG